MNDAEQMRNLIDSVQEIQENHEVLAGTSDQIQMIERELAEIKEKIQKKSFSDVDKLISALYNVNHSLQEINQSSEVSEELGSEKLAPRVDKEGHRIYNDPHGDSYAARNGFVG